MQETFGAVGVSERVVTALRKRGLTAPFKIQTLVLRDAIAGRDVLARSPTGSGKTLAFAIPIVERLDPSGRGPGALVLVPTRELARQVTDELRASGPRSRPARRRGLRRRRHRPAGAPRSERALHRGHAGPPRGPARPQAHPPRQRQDPRARRGRPDARPRLPAAVDRILSVLPRERQTMFFSATLDGVVAKHAERSTRDPLRVEAELPVDQIGDVSHQFIGVERDDKIEALVTLLANPDRDLALVFVRTKRGAARLARRLEQRGVRAARCTATCRSHSAQRSLRNFENGRVDTLVATDVAARGLDVDAVTHVINFDPPADAVAYTHRVGRTGRAGRSGTGVTFVLPDEREDITRLADAAELGTELDLAGLRQHKSAPSRNGGRRGGAPRRRRPAAA